MSYRLIPLFVVVAAAGLTGAVTWVISGVHGTAGIFAAGMILCWLLFCVLPWAVLPVGILGGTIAAGLIGDGEMRTLILMHGLPLAAGTAALLTRRVVLGERFRRIHPGLAMALLFAATVIAATYGLAAGNIRSNVVVAAYQIAVIPVYFFLAAYTLNTRRRLGNAAVLYVAAISLMTATEIGSPGRHGGLLTLLALPPLVVLAGRARGWARFGLGLLAAGLSVDVVLASYRGIWLAAGVALAVLVARAGRTVRRGLVAMAGSAVALVTMLSLDSGVRERSLGVALSLARPAGYRIPESAIGLDVFVSRPLFGAGLGQSTLNVYVPGFTTTDVGPVYHAFYVLILANLGLAGVCAVLWPILRATWTGLSERDGLSLSFAALTCGFLAAALVSSPTDGHWELGLLPALTLLTSRSGAWTDRRLVARPPDPPTAAPPLSPAPLSPVSLSPVSLSPAPIAPVPIAPAGARR
jgi:hypothetical protein